MPTVKGGNARGVGQSKQAGYHDKGQIQQTMPEALGRDDVSGAFAGVENEGKHSGAKHSTNVKNRRTKASSEKTPKM